MTDKCRRCGEDEFGHIAAICALHPDPDQRRHMSIAGSCSHAENICADCARRCGCASCAAKERLRGQEWVHDNEHEDVPMERCKRYSCSRTLRDVQESAVQP